MFPDTNRIYSTKQKNSEEPWRRGEIVRDGNEDGRGLPPKIDTSPVRYGKRRCESRQLTLQALYVSLVSDIRRDFFILSLRDRTVSTSLQDLKQ